MSKTSYRTRRAGLAQRAFRRGLDGFYVLNDETGIAIAGPLDRHGEAAHLAFEEQPPAMRVLRIEDGRPAPVA